MNISEKFVMDIWKINRGQILYFPTFNNLPHGESDRLITWAASRCHLYANVFTIFCNVLQRIFAQLSTH